MIRQWRLSGYAQIVKALSEDALPTAAEFPSCNSLIQSIEAKEAKNEKVKNITETDQL